MLPDFEACSPITPNYNRMEFLSGKSILISSQYHSQSSYTILQQFKLLFIWKKVYLLDFAIAGKQMNYFPEAIIFLTILCFTSVTNFSMTQRNAQILS